MDQLFYYKTVDFIGWNCPNWISESWCTELNVSTSVSLLVWCDTQSPVENVHTHWGFVYTEQRWLWSGRTVQRDTTSCFCIWPNSFACHDHITCERQRRPIHISWRLDQLWRRWNKKMCFGSNSAAEWFDRIRLNVCFKLILMQGRKKRCLLMHINIRVQGKMQVVICTVDGSMFHWWSYALW